MKANAPFNGRSNTLLCLMCDAVYKCDLPEDAVRYLINNPHIIPSLLRKVIQNTAWRMSDSAPEKLTGKLATNEGKKMLAELVEDCFPHDDLTTESINFLVENPYRLPDLLQRMVTRGGRKRSDAPDLEEWSRIFPGVITGRVVLSISRMSEKFAFGDEELDAEELRTGRIMTGPDALAYFAALKRSPANLRSAGKYLRMYPKACRDRTIVLLGARGKVKDDEPTMVLVFTWDSHPSVDLWPFESKFSGECSYLLEVSSKGVKAA